MAHFHNQADLMAYEEMGVEKYVFVAMLDSKTSDICQEHDHEVYSYKEAKEGDNFPPLHPNCRSTTRGYLGEEVERSLQRRAKNPITGEEELVGNISYKEWKIRNDIETTDYLVKTKLKNSGTARLSIKQAMKTLPNSCKKMLNDVEFTIIRDEKSYAIGNKIYIREKADKYEVIHEIGHVLSDKLRINSDSRYKVIINKILDKYNENDIFLDPKTFRNPIFRIESSDFITEYQGRIYVSDGFTLSNGKLNYKAFKDFFPEGLRLFYQYPEILVSKNKNLYDYIEEIIYGEKKIR